jgi:tRNA-specific 2-thiouridylase
VSGSPPSRVLDCTAKVRYRQHDVPCRLRVLDDEDAIEVTFAEPQRAVTSGQSVVLYRGEVCLGGATIESSDAPMERLQGNAA